MNKDLTIIFSKQHFLRLLLIRQKIYKIIGKLSTKVATDSEPIPFEKREENLQKLKSKKWGKKRFDCCYFNFVGKIPDEYKNEKIYLIIDIGGEGLYVDDRNNAIVGLTNVMCVSDFLSSTKGKTLINYEKEAKISQIIDIWVEGGRNKMQSGKFSRADIAICNDEIKKYYFDYVTATYAMNTYNKENKKWLENLLNKSCKKFRTANYKEALDIINEFYQKEGNENFCLSAIGHSHLDLAYLWPVRETRRKAVRTLSNALTNIEKYPDYIYGVSQPQQLQWIKEDKPELYKRIASAIKNDRIEVQGGMWVESDTNIVGGESLIRQIIYGNEFWKKEFDKQTGICWLPDVFGYSAALPQILKKTGMDYFMTIKLSWNNINKFPLSTFRWQGLDDSEILVHMPPAGDYNSGANPIANKKARDNYNEKNISNEALLVYGAGDGGGGPGECHIEMLNRQKNLKSLPKIKMEKAADFFDRINENKDKFAIHKGELYLEKHQGTYTTQGKNKWFNRKLEYSLHNYEFLLTVANEKGYGFSKPKLDNFWKEILLYQFHDIIPGSSISRVYEESIERYKILFKEIQEMTKDVLSYLSKEKNPQAINTTGFERNEIIKKDKKWYRAEIKPYSSNILIPINKKKNKDTNYGEDFIENKNFKIVFGENGNIVSLYEKNHGKEFVGKYLNKLNVFHDKKLKYNAWDIDINYTKQNPKEFSLTKYQYIEDEFSLTRRNYYKFNKSQLIQDIILKDDLPYINFVNNIDWNETHKMLRAEFVPGIFSDQVLCDIQFGNIRRSTKTTSKIDFAQFEICAHKYVDVSNDEFGIAVLSDCKYGWRVKEGLISLNLLRSTTYPDKTADRGKHIFSYALMPHKGNAFDAEVIKNAYCYNLPLLVCENSVDICCPIEIKNRNIIIETIKIPEKGKGKILRIYEAEGKQTNCEFSTVEDINIYECDMLENIVEKANELVFKPYEIKTLLML